MDGAGGRKGARLVALLVAGLAIYHLAYLAIYLAKPHPPADPPFSDFYAFWSFGRFLSAHPADRIYDFAALEAFQQSLRPGFASFYPCVYPPFLLLFLAPLAAADYLPAFAIWTATGLVGFALAVGARNWRSPLPWLAVLAPTTILTVVAGQNGLITSALLIGGFRLMPRRPWLAGVLLGLLAFKPQLFVLLPVVLLAGRRWRTLAATGLTVAALVGASLLAFGPPIWTAWLTALPRFSQTLETQRAALGWLMPTVTAGLRGAGASPAVAAFVQLLVAAAVVAALVVLFHRNRSAPSPSTLDTAALQVGVFLTTPYAFIYDMPMVSAAVVALAAARLAPDQTWRPGERVITLAGYALPLLLFSGPLKTVPLGPIVLAALFVVLVRAAWDFRSRTAP